MLRTRGRCGFMHNHTDRTGSLRQWIGIRRCYSKVDMFEAKRGNCVFFLGAQPQRLDGFENEVPDKCNAVGGLGGADGQCAVVCSQDAKPRPRRRLVPRW